MLLILNCYLRLFKSAWRTVFCLPFVIGLVTLMTKDSMADEPRGLRTRVELEGFLLKKDFASLNSRLAALHKEFKADPAHEDVLQLAFSTFGSENPEFERLIDEWCKATPGASFPFAAKGIYFHAKGNRARGGAWISETSSEQIKAMEASLKIALPAFLKSLALDQHTVFAHHGLLGLLSNFGEPEKTEKFYKQAIQAVPTSFQIRRIYMQGLTPRWGGSEEQMIAFANSSEKDVKLNPTFTRLKGFVYWDEAALFENKKDYKKALDGYNRAALFGDYWLFLRGRARALYRLGRNDEAKSAFATTVASNPLAGDVYRDRIKFLLSIDALEDATKDLETYRLLEAAQSEVDTAAESIAYKYDMDGYNKSQAGELAAALTSYTKAIELDSKNADIYERRSRAYGQLGKIDEGVADIRRAIDLEPNDESKVQMLDWLLVQRQKWDEIIAAWDSFIGRNPKNGQAYMERGGAKYRKGDTNGAGADARKACNFGIAQGCQMAARFGK